MAHKRKGQLAVSSEWAKHLRQHKRLFWRMERRAELQEIARQVRDDTDHVSRAVNLSS